MVSAQRVKCLPAMWETQVQSLHQEDPLEKEMEPTPVLLLGKFHGQRSLVSYSPWGCKELDTTERLHFTSLQAEGRQDLCIITNNPHVNLISKYKFNFKKLHQSHVMFYLKKKPSVFSYVT